MTLDTIALYVLYLSGARTERANPLLVTLHGLGFPVTGLGLVLPNGQHAPTSLGGLLSANLADRSAEHAPALALAVALFELSKVLFPLLRVRIDMTNVGTMAVARPSHSDLSGLRHDSPHYRPRQRSSPRKRASRELMVHAPDVGDFA